MSLRHKDYRFSATLHTDDRSVVNCLRALSQVSQLTGNVRIPWGGTKDSDWERDGHQVTFRFSSIEYRLRFLAEAERVLRPRLYSVVRLSDSDPAIPQA